MERLEKLYRLARRRLPGYHHVTVHHGNGTLGWPAHPLRRIVRLADQRSPRRCRSNWRLADVW